MEAMKPIRFRFAPQKAFAALHHMVAQHQTIDLHAALKACYFADKKHLNEFYRPIFGATYRAMKFGPVPLEIYEMAKGEALWLAELQAETLPWTLDGYKIKLASNEPADLEALSETDVECLDAGLSQSLSMNFNERTRATHGRDWQKADLGVMSYEDMVEESPLKAAIITDLRETGRFLRL